MKSSMVLFLERVMKATANGGDRVSLNHKDLHHKYALQVDHHLPSWKLARSQFTINSITLSKEWNHQWFYSLERVMKATANGDRVSWTTKTSITNMFCRLTIAFLCKNLPVPSSQLTPLPFPRNGTLDENDPWFLGEGNESNCQQWSGKFEPQRHPSQICFAGWPPVSLWKLARSQFTINSITISKEWNPWWKWSTIPWRG